MYVIEITRWGTTEEVKWEFLEMFLELEISNSHIVNFIKQRMFFAIQSKANLGNNTY